MKKFKKIFILLLSFIFVFPTNLVIASGDYEKYKINPVKFSIGIEKYWMSDYSGNFGTGASSTLPIVMEENIYNDGLIYDFGQFGGEPTGTRDFLNGNENYGVYNPSDSRETLTTAKYDLVNYDFDIDNEKKLEAEMFEALNNLIEDESMDNLQIFNQAMYSWLTGTEDTIKNNESYVAMPLFYNVGDLDSYTTRTLKRVQNAGSALLNNVSKEEVEYFSEVQDRLKSEIQDNSFSSEISEQLGYLIIFLDQEINSKIYSEVEEVNLEDEQREKIERILKLGYSEANSEVAHKGTALWMMSNIDGYLATQWNLYNILKDDFNLSYEGTNWDHEGENIRVTQIREFDEVNEISRNSFFLEEAILNLSSLKEDDLTVKFNKQSSGLTETNLAEEVENYVKEYKFTIPVDQDLYDSLTPEGWKLKEHEVGVENIKLSLDTDIKDAKVLITRENKDGKEEFSYDLGANPVEIKQGDNIKVIIPKESVKELNKDVELKLTYEEPEFDFDIINTYFNEDNINKIESFGEEYKSIVDRNSEGFKYLIVKDKKMVEKSFDDLYKFKYEKEEPEGNGNSGGSSNNKNKNKEENKRPKIEQENLELHKAYIKGYEDGTFRPQENITRAEVATIFSRIMTNQEDINYSNSQKYTDVKSSDWYAKYISFVSDNKIMKGYPEGDFEPNDSITRAELTAVVSRYKNLNQGENKFEDSKNHWAEDYIGYASTAGYIVGYPDGTFKPDKNVSREEAVTMINRMLGRKVDDEGINNQNISKFKDLDKNSWSYYDIVEASNSHKYDKEDKSKEIWEEIVK